MADAITNARVALGLVKISCKTCRWCSYQGLSCGHPETVKIRKSSRLVVGYSHPCLQPRMGAQNSSLVYQYSYSLWEERQGS